MNTVYIDACVTDAVRRQRLYEGQLFVYSPMPSSAALCEFARGMIEEAFKGMDPLTAQHYMKVEEYAAILARLKPSFIHHPKAKELLQKLLEEMGCERDKTYFDVPRLRSSTSGNYLTTGIAYAWHPHRDTWYSAPSCQINWWIPIYEISSDNAMAFHPKYWMQPVQNDSAKYDYAEWNRTYRYNAAQHIGEDPRPLPRATEPMEMEPQLRLICRPGGIILFSAAQMHSSVPNTSGVTRFSIDFRTVHLDDVSAFRGAPNIDAACTGTTMNDYLRVSDLSHISEEIVLGYNTTSGKALK
jgi:hypothetical protein